MSDLEVNNETYSPGKELIKLIEIYKKNVNSSGIYNDLSENLKKRISRTTFHKKIKDLKEKKTTYEIFSDSELLYELLQLLNISFEKLIKPENENSNQTSSKDTNFLEETKKIEEKILKKMENLEQEIKMISYKKNNMTCNMKYYNLLEIIFCFTQQSFGTKELDVIIIKQFMEKKIQKNKFYYSFLNELHSGSRSIFYAQMFYIYVLSKYLINYLQCFKNKDSPFAMDHQKENYSKIQISFKMILKHSLNIGVYLSEENNHSKINFNGMYNNITNYIPAVVESLKSILFLQEAYIFGESNIGSKIKLNSLDFPNNNFFNTPINLFQEFEIELENLWKSMNYDS